MKWPVVKIGDLIEQIRGVTYSSGDAIETYKDGYVELLRANNISNDGVILFDDITYVPSNKVSDKQLLRNNDILIAASSGSISVVGKAASFNADRVATFGAFCKVLRPSAKVDARYLANYFQTSGYRKRISFLAAGANINNLRNEHIDSLDIVLPPLAEQKRIAALLDTADSIVRLREQVIAKLDELAKSVFIKKIDEIDCKEVDLNDIAEMYQPKTISTNELIENGRYLVYGANGIIGRYDKFNHEEDEVLVTCRGATCGTINRSKPFSWITGNAMVVKPLAGKVTKDFLQYYFKFCADFSSVITGAAQPQITRQTLSRLTISLPNLANQNEISDAVNQILSKHKLMILAKIKSEALISSLQHQSFAVK